MISEIELEEKMSNTSKIALDNVIIAEFEKLNTKKFVNSGILNYLYVNNNNYEVWCEPHELSYDKDWNWLMKVVDKINTMDNYKFSVNIHYHFTTITNNFTLMDIVDEGIDHYTKTSCYRAVVEFIKKYNNKNNG